MSHIELDIKDLTMLSDKISEIDVKISNLQTIIDSKFGRAKKHGLYINGFKKIKNYLEDQSYKMNEMKRKIERFQSEIISEEKAYSDRFNDINVPTFQSNISNLSLTREPTINLNYSKPVDNEIVSSLESINDENVSYQEQDNKESESNNMGALGSLAAAAGIVGAAGFGAASLIRSKAKEDNQETKHVEIQPNEQHNQFPFLFEDYNKKTQQDTYSPIEVLEE